MMSGGSAFLALLMSKDRRRSDDEPLPPHSGDSQSGEREVGDLKKN
jgi:hypothetical protein